MRLCAVDADGDLSAGGTELLEESAVRPDPQVLLGDLHLKDQWTPRSLHGRFLKHADLLLRGSTHSAQVP